jgi:hypothetical protein
MPGHREGDVDETAVLVVEDILSGPSRQRRKLSA